jgi:hypothetical protein
MQFNEFFPMKTTDVSRLPAAFPSPFPIRLPLRSRAPAYDSVQRKQRPGDTVMQSDTKEIVQIDPAESAANFTATDGLALFPVCTVALGAPARALERLITLQSLVGKAVDLVAALRFPRARLSRPSWLRLRVRAN